MKRLFTAISVQPHEEFILKLNSLQEILQKESIKWVDIHHMHLTLWFFGDTEEKYLELIGEKLTRATRQNKGFTLGLTGPGMFMKSGVPQVLWVGTDAGKSMNDLALHIKQELRSAKIPGLRDYQFNPHLTLGRVKHCQNPEIYHQSVKDTNLQGWGTYPVKEIHLIESILTPKGPVYEVLNTYKLAE